MRCVLIADICCIHLVLLHACFYTIQVVYCVTEDHAAAAARALSAQASTLCRLYAQRNGVQEELVVFAVPSSVVQVAEGVVQAWRRSLARRAEKTTGYTLVMLLQEAIGMKAVAL